MNILAKTAAVVLAAAALCGLGVNRRCGHIRPGERHHL